MNNFIYNERRMIHPIFWVGTLFACGVLAYTFVAEPEKNNFGVTVFYFFLTAIMVFIIVNFAFLAIKVDKEKLYFSFGLFRKACKVNEIEDLEIEKYSFKEFGGYGIRKSFQKTTGFIARGGAGIRFKDKESGKKIFLSTENAEQLKGVLLNLGAKIKRS